MIPFSKLSGCGNDFIALVEPDREPSAEEIVAWCRRGTSEGADGLFILERAADAVRMRHFNSDGRSARLCLNGTRCAARLAIESGWATGSVPIETGAGRFVAADAGNGEIELELPAPGAPPQPHTITLDATAWPGWRVTVGVPHLVVPWKRPMSEAPVSTVGARLRAHDSLAPEGANVSFVDLSRPNELPIRTFERGVEAETLACGTGVLAATLVALTEGATDLPVVAMTRGGFPITVTAADRPGHWRMRGDARLVAQGTLRPGAAEAPTAPDW